MKIAGIIQANRKKKGYTQERLAEMVGVSAPAVSKWESGASLPDLPLIVPIARALGVTADELLGFTATLHDEEVNTLETECAEVFLSSGYEAGKARCEALLREYPNCTYLKFRVSALYQRFLITQQTKPDANIEPEFERIYALMQEVYDSGDSRLHAAAASALASYALMRGELERAEALLGELPKTDCDPDELYPMLYWKKGDTTHAVHLLEQRVYRSAMEASRALQMLSTIAAQAGEASRALDCARASVSLNNALGIQEITGCMQLLNLLHHAEAAEAAEAAVTYLDSLAALDNNYSSHSFLSHIELAQRPEQLLAVKRVMLEGIEQADEYAPLRVLPQVQQALERLRAAIRQPSAP